MKNLLIWLCVASTFLVSCKVQKSSSGDRDSDIMRVSAVPIKRKAIPPTTPTVFVEYPSYEFPEDSTHLRRMSSLRYVQRRDSILIPIDKGLPQYSTREFGFVKYCQDSIVYPKSRLNPRFCISRRDVIRFVVTDKGEIDSVKDISELTPIADANMIEIIKKSKKWKPAIRNGKAVSTIVYLPINFNAVPINGEYKDTTLLEPTTPAVLVGYPSYEFPEDSTHLVRRTANETSQNYIDSILPRYATLEYGSEYNFREYCQNSIVYPSSVYKWGIECRIIVRFVVTKEGEVENVSVVKDSEPACDRAALVVVKKSPKWKPAIRNGKPVSTTVYLPVNFRLVPIRNNQQDSSHDTK